MHRMENIVNNKNLTYKNTLCMHFTEPSSTVFIQPKNATATTFFCSFSCGYYSRVAIYLKVVFIYLESLQTSTMAG